MPSEREGGDPRNNAEDAYLTFMEMSDAEWGGLMASLFRGGMLQPAEHEGWVRACADRRPFDPVPTQRVEYSEWLAIEENCSYADQESSFMNGTLQEVTDHGLCFTVQTHVGIPGSITTEKQLALYLADVLGQVTNLEIAFDVQTGRTEDDDV